jgi:hypothetical protein
VADGLGARDRIPLGGETRIEQSPTAPGGVPLLRLRAVERHQARHQERQEEHPRDRLEDGHEPSFGRDGGWTSPTTAYTVANANPTSR